MEHLSNNDLLKISGGNLTTDVWYVLGFVFGAIYAYGKEMREVCEGTEPHAGMNFF